LEKRTLKVPEKRGKKGDRGIFWTKNMHFGLGQKVCRKKEFAR